jgi:hypothetical protein
MVVASIINGNLCDYCRWNDNRGVASLLAKHRDLDLTVDEGIYFRLAIKHNNPAMLKTLLKYYENEKLTKSDKEKNEEYKQSDEYKAAKYQLKKIFEEAEERFNISPEMQEIIAPYVATDEGLLLLKVKQNLSDNDFTVPYFYRHLDQVGFNNADEEDMRAVLDELRTLESNLSRRYSGNTLQKKNSLIESQIQSIKVALDSGSDSDLGGFDDLPDQWDGDDDIGLKADRYIDHDTCLMGADEYANNHAAAAE